MEKETKINNNDQNKKWVVIGSALLALTILVIIFSTFSNKKLVNSKGYNADVPDLDISSDITVREWEVATSSNPDFGDPILAKLFSNEPNITLANGKVHDRPMYYYFTGSQRGTERDFFIYCIELGNRAYVSNSGTQRPLGTSSNFWSELTSTAKKGISLATVYGFPNVDRKNSYNFSKDGKTRNSNYFQYFATQSIIWEFQQGWRTNYEPKLENSPIYKQMISQDEILLAIYKDILKDMKEYSTTPSFASSNEADAKVQTLLYNASTKKYEATFTDSNGVFTGWDLESCTSCEVTGNTLKVSSATPINFTLKMHKDVPSSMSQSQLIIDNGKDQRMIVGKAKIDESFAYLKLQTEKLGSLKIVKTSEDKKVSDIKFTVTYPDGTTKDYSTNSSGVIEINNLKLGKYVVTEKVDTTKYLTQKAQTINLTESAVIGTANFDNILINKSVVKVGKQDAASKGYVAGAALEVKKGNTVIETVVTVNGLTELKTKLDINTEYQLCEKTAPNGYVLNKKCESFTVKSKDETVIVVIEDEMTKMYISKVDENGKPLVGATLQVLDSTGKVIVPEWESSESKREVRGLVIGQKYILRETKAPSGYIKSKDKEFTATQDSTVVMENKQTEVVIKKTDITGTKELDGAHLKVLDSNGNPIAECISGSKNKEEICNFKGLIVGQKYTLVETIAPEGYGISEESVTFEVRADGITNVPMKNDVTRTYFSKIDATNSEEIAGAHLEIIDPDTNEVIVDWISEEGKSKVIEGLIDKHTYILRETIAPDGYVRSTDVSFTVGETAKVVMENNPTKVIVEKRDEVSNELVSGAVLQLIDPDGEVLEEWNTENENPKEFMRLKTGVEYTIKETASPDGYLLAEDKHFTISESEKDAVTVIVLNTPIIPVPNTAANVSTTMIIIGLVLLLGGVGTVIWIKKRA